VASGDLDPGCAEIFPLSLYKHQEQAIAKANRGASYVVTTGTGSGKSLCFFIPIVSAVLAEKRTSPARRTRAIVIYPMNALANSQLEELAKYIPDRPGGRPVTFARFTGQEGEEERRHIAQNAPDILLTNFMMLELLLTRQDELDRKVIGNCAGLRFLVLDEFHTYRGRQGADVAMLVRRVRERMSSQLQCIGTSATMKSDGSVEERSRVVAEVAAKIFATPISADCVIGETLRRVTNTARTRETVRDDLGPAIAAGIPDAISDAELRDHPLAIWVETCLGVQSTDEMPAWHRAPPLSLSEACELLSAESGRPVDECRGALRKLLLVSSVPERDRVPGSSQTESFFPFRLHQFISGAGHAFATLEPPGSRRVTVEGQLFYPGAPNKRLYAVHFCRECGQEYHPVRLVTEEGRQHLLARDIDDALPTDDNEGDDAGGDREEIGFLTIRTPVALLRLRHQLTAHRGRRSQVLLVEEASALAWCGAEAALSAEGDEALALLVPPPVAEPPPPVRDRFAAQALALAGERKAELDAFARRRAEALLADHERVRESSQARGRSEVHALLPPDVIGLFVLLPKVG
jgi:hypothetical protein